MVHAAANQEPLVGTQRQVTDTLTEEKREKRGKECCELLRKPRRRPVPLFSHKGVMARTTQALS